MVKPRSRQAGSGEKTPRDTDSRIDALADKLADTPYGKEGRDETIVTVSISLPAYLRDRLDDIALERKRAKAPNRSVSAVIREALDEYLTNNNS